MMEFEFGTGGTMAEFQNAESSQLSGGEIERSNLSGFRREFFDGENVLRREYTRENSVSFWSANQMNSSVCTWMPPAESFPRNGSEISLTTNGEPHMSFISRQAADHDPLYERSYHPESFSLQSSKNSTNSSYKNQKSGKRSSVPANPVSYKHPGYVPPSSDNLVSTTSSGRGKTQSVMPNGSASLYGEKQNSSFHSYVSNPTPAMNTLPVAPTMQSVSGSSLSVFEVQFKCHTHFYMIGPAANCPLPPSIGDFVVVEADRGEDLGVITDALSKEALVEKRANASKLYPFTTSGFAGSVIGKIKRVATNHDQLLLPQKAFDEEHILQDVRDLAYNKYQFPLTFHDAVYQFDRHKLTFFYSSEVRIDFRDFVRELFTKYHTRIWMHEIHYANVPLIKFDNWASVALATGMKIAS